MSDSKTPVVLRNQVIGMHRAGYSVRKIAEKLAISRGFVQNAICKHKTGKSLEDAPRSGRPSKITPRKKRRLIRNLNTDRSQTSAELGQTTFGNISGISPRCVRRCLFKHGFKKCRASKTPLLTYLQKLRRLRWAAAHKHYDFHKVIFSDEKRFAKRPDGPTMVWRRPGESRDPRCTQKHTKFGGGGLLIWGAISYYRKFPLVHVAGTLNAQGYISQILQQLLPRLPRATRKRLILMQDGATCHTAREVALFLANHNVQVLEDWPSNSPDLNPMENLWGYMEHKLKNRVCATNEELWEQIQSVWDSIPLSYIQSLFDSMPKRLRAVKKKNGGTIKY